MSSSDTIIKISELMIPGNTAVVTGASSGIGKAASLTFAKAGMNVWMLDIDMTELLEAQKFVKSESSHGENQLILAEKVDVSDQKAMEQVAEQVFSNGHCNILMNNAGTGMGGGAIDTAVETVQKTMGVNLYGPIHGVLSFAPKMKESGQPGIIINTGSKQGITMPPGNLTYNMSKSALKCYTEGLEHELMKSRLEGGKLRAALLVPGWVNTSILLKVKRDQAEDPEKFDSDSVFFHEGKPASGAWMPQQVIDFMIQELDKGRFYVMCPDNDVDRETDNLRMTWTMQDITEDRPPLSRWHPDYNDKFTEFLEKSKSKE